MAPTRFFESKIPSPMFLSPFKRPKSEFKLRKVTVKCLQTPQSLFRTCEKHGLKFVDEYPEEYEVEKIITDVVEEGIHWYLLKWKGYYESEASWEPASYLTSCEHILAEYTIRKQLLMKPIVISYELATCFIKHFVKNVKCDIPSLIKICCAVRACKSMPSPSTKEDIDDLKTTALEIETFTDKIFQIRSQRIINAVAFTIRRADASIALKQWEDTINKTDVSLPKISVVNDIDCDGPPIFNYIEGYVYTGVAEASKTVAGCDCLDCGINCDGCCPALACENYAYNFKGELQLTVGHPIFECNKYCLCDASCPNRIVQKGRKVHLQIFKTRNRGWGVRAMDYIRKGQFITEYCGEIVTEKEADRRRYRDEESYLFDLDFEFSKLMNTIDARHYGNISRFINHSCDPNTAVYAVWIDHYNPYLPRLAFFAIKDIRRFQEITFDYQMSLTVKGSSGKGAKKNLIPCLCGAKKCQKFLVCANREK